ncbi:hypothetical protein LTR01_007192 [Friedmanniomyces endolithicus]|nr:hypothetical protein LTR01_007192 [Friedmanniomyces endolithicus]
MTPDARALISHLLGLPPELRIHIYELVLLSQPGDPFLLQSSRQINMEAQPTLYRRPLVFASQANLFLWIDRSRSCNLKRVKSMTLRLTDIDLTPLLCLQHRDTRTSVWDLYQQELERLDRELEVLPKLEHLTIVPPRAMHLHLLRVLYLSFLTSIHQWYPRMERPVVADDEAAFDTSPLRSGSIECPRPAQEMNLIHVARSASPAACTNVGYSVCHGELVATPVSPRPRKGEGSLKSVRSSTGRVSNIKAGVRVNKRISRPRRGLGCRQRG